MKVRVFAPRDFDPADASAFSGTDHVFPALPSVGHVLHFMHERAGEFTVAKVGFIQEGPIFVAAIWLDGPQTRQPSIAEPGGQDRYRDLNYDIPPESMEGY